MGFECISTRAIVPQLCQSLGCALLSAQHYSLDSIFFFKASPRAYGSSQIRGPMRATAAGIYHSNSNSRFKPHLQLTPQLMAMMDP